MANPKEIAQQFIDAFNAHDEQSIRELNSENTKFEAPGDVKLQGREPATQYAMAWLNAFPDARINVTNELIAGDWVVQEFTFSGTHEGTLMSPAGEIPPTHKSLNGRGVQLVHVEDNEVVDGRLYFDQVEVMTQLGLMPEPATA
jgi:steroid delta-isomerase-like uncharacterized protein